MRSKVYTILLSVLVALSPGWASAARITDDVLKLGKPGSSANKRLQVGTGEIRFNNSTSKLQFAHDGSTFSDVGAVVSPTVQKFLSGSGTYTKPAAAKYLRIVMVGAGGGGGGAGSGSGTGGTGGNTTFGSMSAPGGGGGTTSPGAGGAAPTLDTAVGIGVAGGPGVRSGIATAQAYTNMTINGGHGCTSPLGGAGAGGFVSNGTDAVANTGSGGGGGDLSINVNSGQAGAGGGCGSYIDALIASPSSSYSYSVGTGGSGGAAGTAGRAGGAGGSGQIVVYEYYQ